ARIERRVFECLVTRASGRAEHEDEEHENAVNVHGGLVYQSRFVFGAQSRCQVRLFRGRKGHRPNVRSARGCTDRTYIRRSAAWAASRTKVSWSRVAASTSGNADGSRISASAQIAALRTATSSSDASMRRAPTASFTRIVPSES